MNPFLKTALNTFLALALVSLIITGCGKSKSSGGSAEPVAESSVWYKDLDADGFGDENTFESSDTQPEGFVDNPIDCDDTDAAVNPMAPEIMDDLDNNCNGETDESPKAGIIPDSGQTASYTDTFGEDSDFVIDPSSYTKLDENGQPLQPNATAWRMVKDNVTGLIWEAKDESDGVVNLLNSHDPDNTYSWSDANTGFIDALNAENLGNFSDGYSWRLPTIRELSLLSNNGVANPSLNTTYFPRIVAGIWSSTHSVTPNTSVFYFIYNVGMALQDAQTAKYRAWAVRGKEADSSFEDTGSGTVTDTTTGLMWQQTDDGSGYAFEQALCYCRNLTLSGYRDWRLPNKNELMTLLRFEKENPSIQSDMFPETKAFLYWTSTTQNFNHSYTWCVDFSDSSFAHTHLKTSYALVRAVRGGNISNLNTWYKDSDGDGYGDRAVFVKIVAALPQPTGYVSGNTDCNDSNSYISPAAAEIPNDGIDQNCNGSDLVTWYADSDGDTFGSQTETILSETQETGYVRNSEDIVNNRFDCNDLSIVINPDMAELLDDGLDNNCSSRSSVSWYPDEDGDGYGKGPRVAVGENQPLDMMLYASNDLDCHDHNPLSHPGLVEIYGDSNDTNCNGDVDDLGQRIIPDTGQLTSHTSTGGEDANYLINPPSYEKISETGTVLSASDTRWAAVHDKVTDLYWEVKTDSSKTKTYTYAEALSYVAGLNLAGRTDWRLPTVTDLSMITDLDSSNPAIRTDYFPNMQSDRYWTDSDYGTDGHYLSVSFRYGECYPVLKTDHLYVITVSGGSFEPFLIKNSDGTVTEKASGLMWNGVLSGSGTWNDSVSFWNSTTSCGYTDWRLPTEAEVGSLLEIIESDPSLNLSDYFTLTHLYTTYWSYTLSTSKASYAVYFSLSSGQAGIQGINSGLYSLGVRGTMLSRFIDNGDGTVLDSKTGLMWLKENGNNGEKMAFTGALSSCNDLTFAGYSDWRLPSRNELLSLLDAAIHSWDDYVQAFPGTGDLYWTSSSSSALTQNAWQINFTNNTTNPPNFHCVLRKVKVRFGKHDLTHFCYDNGIRFEIFRTEKQSKTFIGMVIRGFLLLRKLNHI
ncbi:MAG: DUF1566 domain-containing protein [Desulfobacteraceae bacterium]